MSDTIMERILKLLALAADSGATPGEAENAAAMASKLMFKHQIDEAKVFAKQKQQRPGQNSANYAREIVAITKSAAWERELLSWLCMIHDLHLFKHGKWEFEIIGHRDNVSLVTAMQSWLVRELTRLASVAYKTNRPDNDLLTGLEHMDPMRFHVSFKRGATATIADRLQKQRRAQKAEARATAEGANALMIIANDKNEALFHYYPHMRDTRTDAQKAADRAAAVEWARTHKTRRSRGRKEREVEVSAVAYGAGKIAGSTVRLTGQKELNG